MKRTRGTSLKSGQWGDVWVHSNNIFNPINVKAGLQGMKGQPNLVSMRKLLDYIFKGWIDSYYLLIVKFDVATAITHKAYLIDLLDWTEFIAYNAGPGQIMLSEHKFYEAFESGHVPAETSIANKVEGLFARFEDGVRALFRNRQQRLERQRAQFEIFAQQPFVVDQSALRFVP